MAPNINFNHPRGKVTGGSTQTKSGAQNNEATMIPKNELLDLRFECFHKSDY